MHVQIIGRPVLFVLGPMFQLMHLAVPETSVLWSRSQTGWQEHGFPRLSGALKTPGALGETDETDHMIHVHLHVENLRYSSKGFRRKDA